MVNVDVVVTDNDGNYLNGLKKENFRVTEDGAPQVISNFATDDAPITVVLLLEFSQLGYGWFLFNARNWADTFLHQIKPNDWVALESFNMRDNVEVDFTHDPTRNRAGPVSLSLSAVSRIESLRCGCRTRSTASSDVKGKKSILVLASGIDTFSKLTLDKTLSRFKETDVTIYCVGVAEAADCTHRFGRRTYLPAGAESARNLRRNDRRPQLVPALRRRNSGDHGRRGRQPAQ